MSKVISNSAVAVDFNKEISGLMNDSAHANGRELKLAVAIHNDPANFAIANLLGGVGSKSKAVALRASLLTHSEAFKLHCGKADIAKKAANQKSMKGFAAKAEYEAANRVVAAALSMYERALTAAYFMMLGKAVITKVTDKLVTLRLTTAVTIGDVTYDAGTTDTFTRKNVHELGRKLATSRGIFAPSKKNVKAPVSTGKQSTILESAGVFADTVAALPEAEKADISTSAGFEKMLAASLRARFAADGSIDVNDIIDFMRKSDALQGVAINTAVKPERKPRKQAA